MNTNRFPQDDELILFALGTLTSEESQRVSAQLTVDEDARQRHAEILKTLGMYAEATTDSVNPPIRCFDRLMAEIAGERSAATRQVQPIRLRYNPVFPWLGWVIATLTLCFGVWQWQKNQRFTENLETASEGTASVKTQLLAVTRERDTLQSSLREIESRANASSAEFSSRSAQLTQKAASASVLAQEQGKRASQLAAKVKSEASRAAEASARADALASSSAATAGERDQLRDSLRVQEEQIAQAAEAQQVLDALSDPTAIRGTLVVPKQKKTPSGRGTYVPSRGTLLFAGSNLPQLRNGKVYELWLMPSDGSAPIPAGTFLPDSSGNATLVMTSFRKHIAAKGFALTAEPAGGSQTPTLPILLAAL